MRELNENVLSELSMAKQILMQGLGFKSKDLQLLLTSNMSMIEVIEKTMEDNRKIDGENLVKSMFEIALNDMITDLEKGINDYIEHLEGEDWDRGLQPFEVEILNTLKSLNPKADFILNDKVECVNQLEFYKKYLFNGLNKFTKKTNVTIS